MNMAVIFPLYGFLCVCAGVYAGIKLQNEVIKREF